MPYYASGSHGRGKSQGEYLSLEQLSEEERKITGLVEAIKKEMELEYISLICDWNSTGKLLDLGLFPEQDIGVYVVFRYCQTDLTSHYTAEWDEVTVGAVRKGKNYNKIVKDTTLNMILQETSIRNVKVTNEDITVDLMNGRGDHYSLKLEDENARGLK